jgi:cytochrome c biogenesis protein CcmG, thiol:disulfide interchange protein DsbE
VESEQPAPPVPAGRGSRKVVGPFTARQLSIAMGVVMVAAIVLYVVTRPVAPGAGAAGLAPVPAATMYLVGSPTVGLAPGDIAPELSVAGPNGSAAPLLDLGGKPVRLADLRGRLVLLNFWATWCPPCQAETPVLRDLDEQYRGRGLAVVGIAVQETTPADVAAYAAKYGLGYTIAFDATADAFRAYKVFALPTQVLVGPDGRILQVVNGPLTDASAKALIEPLLPQPAAATPSSSPSAPTSPPGSPASPAATAAPGGSTAP